MRINENYKPSKDDTLEMVAGHDPKLNSFIKKIPENDQYEEIFKKINEMHVEILTELKKIMHEVLLIPKSSNPKKF